MSSVQNYDLLQRYNIYLQDVFIFAAVWHLPFLHARKCYQAKHVLHKKSSKMDNSFSNGLETRDLQNVDLSLICLIHLLWTSLFTGLVYRSYIILWICWIELPLVTIPPRQCVGWFVVFCRQHLFSPSFIRVHFVLLPSGVSENTEPGSFVAS